MTVPCHETDTEQQQIERDEETIKDGEMSKTKSKEERKERDKKTKQTNKHTRQGRTSHLARMPRTLFRSAMVSTRRTIWNPDPRVPLNSTVTCLASRHRHELLRVNKEWRRRRRRRRQKRTLPYKDDSAFLNIEYCCVVRVSFQSPPPHTHTHHVRIYITHACKIHITSLEIYT